MSNPNDPSFGEPHQPPVPDGGAFAPPPAPGGPAFAPPPAPPQGGAFTPPPAPGGFPPPAPGGYTPPQPPQGMPQGPGGFMPPPPSAYETYQPGLGIGGPTKAEPGMRLLARIIDSILVGVIGFVIGLIFGVGAAFTASDNAGVSIGSSIIAGLIGTLIAIAYEVFLVGTRGQTLGKMAVGIKVIRTDGQPMDLMTAATRHSPSIALRVLGIIPIVGIITGLGLIVLAIVNCVMVFSNGESVYDKIGKTMVVSAK